MSQNALDRFIQSASFQPERSYIPFSLPSLNAAIDNKRGLQRGRMLDIVGTFSTGKTTLAYDLVFNAQKQGLTCHYIDVERSFDSVYAQRCNVDLNNLSIVRADTAENNLALAEIVARRGSALVIIDSITFLVPQSHNDNAVDDENVVPEYEKSKKMAALGSLLGDFCKRMVPIIDYHNTLLVFINQYRANFSTISRVEKKPYGPFAYNHALTWRLELARVKNEDNKATVECRVTKNRLGKERGMAEYTLVYGQGLDVKADIIANAVKKGIVTQKGAWLYYNDVKVQGLDRAKEAFDFDRLKEQINDME